MNEGHMCITGLFLVSLLFQVKIALTSIVFYQYFYLN